MSKIIGGRPEMLNVRFRGSIVALILALMLGANLQRLVAQDFKVSAKPLTPSPVNSGGKATATVTVTSLNGFNKEVVLSASCPSGAECKFAPTKVTPNDKGVNSELTIVPTDSTSVSSGVIITGTSDALSHTASITLNVQLAGTSATSASDRLKNDFGFGLALGMTANVVGPNIVNNASIDSNGIVRVNTRANTTAGFMLETHYFIWPRPKDEVGDTRSWGHGPFVAAQPGSSQIIQAVGAGWMVGFRRQKGSKPSGFGLGVGYESIPAAQVLGSEFVDGKPAPLGPNGMPLPIRFETQDKGSVLVILSISF